MEKTATFRSRDTQGSRVKPGLPGKVNGKDVKALGEEGRMGTRRAIPSRGPAEAHAKGSGGDFWKPKEEYLEEVKLRRLGVVETTNNSETPFWMMG